MEAVKTVKSAKKLNALYMEGGLLGDHGEHVQNLVEMELKLEPGPALTQSHSIME